MQSFDPDMHITKKRPPETGGAYDVHLLIFDQFFPLWTQTPFWST